MGTTLEVLEVVGSLEPLPSVVCGVFAKARALSNVPFDAERRTEVFLGYCLNGKRFGTRREGATIAECDEVLQFSRCFTVDPTVPVVSAIGTTKEHHAKNQ